MSKDIKNKKVTVSDNSTVDETKQKKVYQALIIANDIDESLQSFDSELSICLQEVAGAAILDYILKCLNHHKISDIFVITSGNKQKLENHLSSYTTKRYPKKVTLLYSDKCRSLGDFMRETSTLRVIKDDFVLINGKTVLSMDIGSMLENYEATSKSNKSTIMLKAFSRHSTISEHRTEGDNHYVLVDNKNQLLAYETAGMPYIKIKENHRVEFKSLNNFRLRFDLYDTMVSVCHPNVFNYYNENFDYHIEGEFLDELLKSEISSESVSVYELPKSEYALQVQTPTLLLKANIDGLKGYIDSGMINYDPSSSSKYVERYIKTQHVNSFYSRKARPDFDCFMGNNVLVMEDVELGKNSRICSTILQAGVLIGESCSTSNTILSRDSKVGSGTFLKSCCIGKGAVVGDECRLIAVTLEEGAKVGNKERLENSLVKKDGTIIQLKDKGLIEKQLLEDETEFQFGEEEEEEQAVLNFDHEVLETIKTSVEEALPVQVLIQSVTSLKLSMNKSMKDCIKAVTISVSQLLREKLTDASREKVNSIIGSELKDNKELISHFMKDKDDEAYLINCLKDCWPIDFKPRFSTVVQLFYTAKIITEQAVIDWYEELKLQETHTEDEKAIIEKLVQFVDYCSAEIESGDSEDSGEDEESSSEGDDDESAEDKS